MEILRSQRSDLFRFLENGLPYLWKVLARDLKFIESSYQVYLLANIFDFVKMVLQHRLCDLR